MRVIVEFLFPECCPSCGGATPAGFCPGCRGDFARSDGELPLSGRDADPLAALVAPFRYAPPLDGYIQALKFGGARRLGRALGLLLADEVAPRAAGRDALVPVPLHLARLRARGYNQAVEIARPLAARFGLPLLLRGIARSRATPPQTGLDARERARNVRGAFAVRRPLDGLRIAIVDDVCTTGATLRALAAALRTAGAADVEAWAVAHTPPPRDR
ncbi:MAG TPA: phosphoribosyltransferase family protein [Gammaproteobacteria bacterium]